MALSLYDELRDLVAALEAAQVPYALIGGLALAIWGAPRATADIDLLVRMENVADAIQIARDHGYTVAAMPVTFRDGSKLHRVSRIEDLEALTLDLLEVNENLERAWQSRQKIDLQDGCIWVISREALIEMKASANRTQDIADIERLREADR